MRRAKVNKSYLAGLVDGEGYIGIGKCWKYNPKQKKKYWSTAIRMEVCNTDFGLVQDCYDFFKIGTIIDIKPRITAKGTTTKPQKRWNLTHRQAYIVCKELLPYLRNKDKLAKAKAIIKHYEAK